MPAPPSPALAVIKGDAELHAPEATTLLNVPEVVLYQTWPSVSSEGSEVKFCHVMMLLIFLLQLLDL